MAPHARLTDDRSALEALRAFVLPALLVLPVGLLLLPKEQPERGTRARLTP